MDEIELVELKRKIAEAKQASAELKGQKTVLMKTLKDDWKCNTLEEGNNLLTKMTKNLDKLNNQIEKGLVELEEKYDL